MLFCFMLRIMEKIWKDNEMDICIVLPVMVKNKAYIAKALCRVRTIRRAPFSFRERFCINSFKREDCYDDTDTCSSA